MSASARATARCWTLSSLHGAELLGALAVAIAAGCPPLLLQPAATNASTATASARAPVTDGASPAAGKWNRGILTELSGRPCLNVLLMREVELGTYPAWRFQRCRSIVNPVKEFELTEDENRTAHKHKDVRLP